MGIFGTCLRNWDFLGPPTSTLPGDYFFVSTNFLPGFLITEVRQLHVRIFHISFPTPRLYFFLTLIFLLRIVQLTIFHISFPATVISQMLIFFFTAIIQLIIWHYRTYYLALYNL